MMNHLKKAGIGTGIHYPIPLHRQKAYASLQYRLGDFPVTEKAAAEIVSLPMFPQLTAAQQARVVDGDPQLYFQFESQTSRGGSFVVGRGRSDSVSHSFTSIPHNKLR